MDKMKYDRSLALELCDEASDLIKQALNKIHAAEALYEREGEHCSDQAEATTKAYDLAARARIALPMGVFPIV